MSGLRNGSVVQIVYPWEPEWGLPYIVERGVRLGGGKPVFIGSLKFEKQIKEIERNNPSIIIGPNPYLREFTGWAKNRFDLRRLRVKSLVLSRGCDFFPFSESIRKELEESWGCKVFDHYGVTEASFTLGLECWEQNGLHLNEYHAYVEVIDPKSGETVNIGEEGELVLVTSKQITPHGVYVSLDEYNNMKGFLHRSQIATGRVRHIERFVRVGQKEVLKVIRVNKFRQEVDLSLKQVTGQEKKEKLIDVKQSEKAKKIMESIKNKLNISEENLSDYIKSIEEKFDSLYLALEEIVREGGEIISGLNIPQQFIDSLVEVSREKIILSRPQVSNASARSPSLRIALELTRTSNIPFFLAYLAS